MNIIKGIVGFFVASSLFFYSSNANAISGGAEEPVDFVVYVNNCTGIIWQPDIVITAAHCVTKPNSKELSPYIYVIHNRQIFNVVRIVRPQNFYFDVNVVTPDDIAFVYLVKEIRLNNYPKIATKEIIDEIKQNNVFLKTYGNGRLCDKCELSSFTKYLVTSILKINDNLNFIYYPANINHTICAGDSGGPTIYHPLNDSSFYIVSITAGTNACFEKNRSFDNLFYQGYIVYPYLDILN